MRQRLNESGGGAYFTAPTHTCFPSGCTLLDCVLGGGYAEGRVINIVGDKSTGKTLLAIEAAANFTMKYPLGKIWYDEVESAFDVGYAIRLGLPENRVTFVEGHNTVEDVFEFLTSVKDVQNSLYILDSLDALTDREEQERKIEDGTYGANKAKKMSELFRRLVRRVSGSNITVIIISQVREAIGVMFGKKTKRSGGKALDFYASQVLYLSQTEIIKRTVHSVERAVGIGVKARCEKNKVGPPFREAEFPVLFYYGIDDVRASLAWLEEVKRLRDLGFGDKAHVALRVVSADPQKMARVSAFTRCVWSEIEAGFTPTSRKYGKG